jgi:glycosyltransferase involved in cell wall biosynthesis
LALAVNSTLLALKSGDELILIVDSDDHPTSMIARSFKDPRVNLVVALPNSGFVTKLNLGIDVARHDLIARMDADDVCLPWRFGSTSKALLKKNVDFVSSTAIVFGLALRPIPVLPQLPIPLGNDEVMEQLSFGNPIVHPTVLMRKDAIKALGGYSDKSGEDLDLWLRAVAGGFKFYRIGFPTLFYRYSKKSMSRQLETKQSIEKDQQIRALRGQIAMRRARPGRLAPKGDCKSGPVDEGRKTSWKAKLAKINLGLNS